MIVLEPAAPVGEAVIRRLAGPGHHVVAADARWSGGDPAAIDVALEEVVARHGGVDVLVHALPERVGGAVEATSGATFLADAATRLRHVFVANQIVARHMAARGRGTIVNLAGPEDGAAADAALAGGIVQLTRVMAVELAPLGVRVNAVAAGRGAAGSGAEGVAGAIAFLCSQDADFVSGQVLPVLGNAGAGE